MLQKSEKSSKVLKYMIFAMQQMNILNTHQVHRHNPYRLINTLTNKGFSLKENNQTQTNYRKILVSCDIF